MTNPAIGDDDQVAQSSSSSLDWKERGNNYYGNRDFGEAAKAYQAGLDALQLEEQNNNADESLPIALRSNLAMTLLKLEEFQRAADECTRILETDPKNTKGM